MKTLLITLCFFFVGCHSPAKAGKIEKVKARITYYYPQAPFWKKVSSPFVSSAKEGETVAAHPDFRYGTKIYIPSLKNKMGDGVFEVQDRGGDVTRKKASKGKGYVFDVFVANYSKLKNMTKSLPMWMDVYVMR